MVALSSTEAENMAAATATKELLQTMIHELNFSLQLPSILFCDNQSCIALTNNPRFHDRSEHVDIRYYFIRENVANKLLQFEYIPTSQLWADILTKSLPKIKHQACLSGITSTALSAASST